MTNAITTRARRWFTTRRTPAAEAPAQPPYTVVGGDRRVRDGEITVTVASVDGVGSMQLRFAGGRIVAGKLPGQGWQAAEQAPAARA